VLCQPKHTHNVYAKVRSSGSIVGPGTAGCDFGCHDFDEDWVIWMYWDLIYQPVEGRDVARDTDQRNEGKGPHQVAPDSKLRDF